MMNIVGTRWENVRKIMKKLKFFSLIQAFISHNSRPNTVEEENSCTLTWCNVGEVQKVVLSTNKKGNNCAATCLSVGNLAAPKLFLPQK